MKIEKYVHARFLAITEVIIITVVFVNIWIAVWIFRFENII